MTHRNKRLVAEALEAPRDNPDQNINRKLTGKPMTVSPFVFDTSKVNRQYLKAEHRPGAMLSWGISLCMVIGITFLKPVQRITGLLPLTTFVILLPHIVQNLIAAVYRRFGNTTTERSIPGVMVAVHINMIVIAALVTAAGKHPWTPIWAGYHLYISILLNAFGMQGYLLGLIGITALGPWLHYLVIGSPLASMYLPVCIIFAVLGMIQYWFVGTVVVRSKRLTALEAALVQEKKLKEEISRIWREIHDGVGAHLTLSLMGNRSAHDALASGDTARAADLVRESTVNISTAMEELREAFFLTRSDPGGSLGDLAALIRGKFSTAFEARATALQVVLKGEESVELEPVRFHALRRIVQESLTNVLRHSNASQVRVDLACRDSVIRIQVGDNGTAPGTASSAGTGTGIESMRKRAREIGAHLSLSHNDRGSVLLVVELAVDGGKSVAKVLRHNDSALDTASPRDETCSFS